MTLHTIEGASAPSSAPPSIGAHYINTATGDQYLAAGASAASDWKLLARADQLPGASELVPSGGATGQVLGAGSNGSRVWVTPSTGGGGDGGALWPTRANFESDMQNGALGRGLGVSANYYNPDIGKYFSYDGGGIDGSSGILSCRSFPWIIDNALKVAKFEDNGIVMGGTASINKTAGILREATTGVLALGVTNSTPVSDAAELIMIGSGPLADIGRAGFQASLSFPQVSDGSHAYKLTITLTLPFTSGVTITYTHGENGGCVTAVVGGSGGGTWSLPEPVGSGVYLDISLAYDGELWSLEMGDDNGSVSESFSIASPIYNADALSANFTMRKLTGGTTLVALPINYASLFAVRA
ncbi:hypothetical protein BWR15_06235 [Pseudomonas sp. T]|nr:hypothetical protein BWR15_06235 [Pseudomonas sp. T]